MLLQASDIQGMYGIIATPANADADRIDAADTVNLAETERMTDALIDAGVSGLITTGTTGECATLTDKEWHDFVDCFLSTVNGRVPTIVGATALGTHQIVERLRFVQEKGADGTLLGLPMWQPCTHDMALKFYEGISAYFPELTLMVYGNMHAFRFDFTTDFWAALVDHAPTVTCAKFGSPQNYQEVLAATNGRINFLPISMSAYEMACVSQPTMTACWDTAAGMGPEPSIALMDAIRANDLDRAKIISEDILYACETFVPPHVFAVFGSYNIQLEKLRIQAAGWSDPGPIRPPYDVVPDDLRAGAVECGRRWAEIRKKYI